MKQLLDSDKLSEPNQVNQLLDSDRLALTEAFGVTESTESQLNQSLEGWRKGSDAELPFLGVIQLHHFRKPAWILGLSESDAVKCCISCDSDTGACQ